MALIFTDPNSAGPFTSFQDKGLRVRVAKLTSANFTTGGTNTLLMMLPADASITKITYWNKTKLAGNSISAATLSIGTTSGGTDIVNGFDVFTTVGTEAALSPIAGIMQPYGLPLGNDIKLYAAGTATTGNPNAGEIYVMVEYVR